MGFLGRRGILGKHGRATADPWPSRPALHQTIGRGRPVPDVRPDSGQTQPNCHSAVAFFWFGSARDLCNKPGDVSVLAPTCRE